MRLSPDRLPNGSTWDSMLCSPCQVRGTFTYLATRRTQMRRLPRAPVSPGGCPKPCVLWVAGPGELDHSGPRMASQAVLAPQFYSTVESHDLPSTTYQPLDPRPTDGRLGRSSQGRGQIRVKNPPRRKGKTGEAAIRMNLPLLAETMRVTQLCRTLI